MSEERKGVGRWFGQADKSDEPVVGEVTEVNGEDEHRVPETQPSSPHDVAPQSAEPVLEPASPDPQVYQEPEAKPTPVAEPAHSDPENELVVVELVGGDRDNVNTRYGTFSKGVSVELNRRMADELLQLRDGAEPLFTEV